MAQALPDPIGGAGYANIFQGSQAVDDWREDLKYNRLRKAKAAEDEAARREKISTKVDPLLGWANRDQPELNKMYEVIQKQALDLKMQGKDPFSDLDFLTNAQKAKGLAAASLEHQKTYEGGLKELDALFKTGAITPETYAQKQQEWENFGMGGGAVKNGVGGIYSRTQMDAPQNPATMPDMLAFIKDNQTILESKKQEVSFPTADGMQKTTVEVPEEEVKKQLDLMRNAPMWNRFTDEQKATIEDAIGFGRKDATKPLPESQRGGSGSGYISGYKTVAIPTNAQSKAQLNVVQQPTSFWQKALSKIGLGSIPANETELKPDIVAPVKLIFKGTEDKEPQPISYKTNDIEGNNIDKFRPYEVRETSKGYLVSGRAVYTENGVNKEMDTAILVTPEQKTDFEAIFMERDDGSIETIEEAIARSGVKKTTKSTTKKSQDDPLGIF